MPGLLLDTLRGHAGGRRPVWLMRQAGRYLPEYRALRAEKGGFLELVYDSEAAAEITLQPIRRFGFDGAILFSDILIVPYAMGQDLAFLAGEGPHLAPRLVDHALGALEAVPARLEPIYRTVALVRDRLDPEITGDIGVALEVYHIWWDPEVLPQIARAGKKRLHAFHVCDWLVPTRDMLNDRGMMGDGVIDIRALRAAVEAEGFAGYSEIEIFSDDWWQRPMDDVLQTCIERHRTVV